MKRTVFELDPSASFSVEDTAEVLADVPELAVLYARVIASWSVVEAYIGLAAASLLAGRTEVAMAMYDAVSGGPSQTNVLYAAAEAALSPQDSALFKAGLKRVRGLGRGRNILAHGVVIRSSAVEDGFAIAEQQHFAEMSRIFFTAPNPGESREEQVKRVTRALLKNSIVFQKAELLRILSDIDKASGLAMDLSMLAAAFHPRRQEAKDNLKAAIGQELGVQR